MSGTLGLSTPWTRQAITKDQRHDVEYAIPDGWTLGVSMTGNRSAWTFWTIDPDGNRSHTLRVSSSMSLVSASFYALRHWAVAMGTSTTYTTDAEGYVRSIEDAE